MTRRELDELTPTEDAEQDSIDEQELKRRYYERLSDWSESGAIKVYCNGKQLGPLAGPDQVELWKRTPERRLHHSSPNTHHPSLAVLPSCMA